MFDVAIRILGDVIYIPNLKRNLISLSTLDSKRYESTGEYEVLKVSNGVLIVMKGQRKSAKLLYVRHC